MGHQPGDLPACASPGPQFALYTHVTSDGRWVFFWTHKAMWVWVKTKGY